MRIIPGLPVIWRDTDQIQIGLDPRTGIILSGLSKSELAFVDSLSAPQSELELKARIRRLRLSCARVKEIVSMLDKARVITREELSLADAVAGVRLHGSIPVHRSDAHVLFTRGDYVSCVAALILADAGVGAIECQDTASVTRTDHPLLQESHGMPRYLAWNNLLRQRHAGVEGSRRPTVVAVSGPHLINPASTAQWLAYGIPIVHTWTEEVNLIVGPTTLPHVSACASCVYLHRLHADPMWQHLAMQAFGRPDVLADISSMELAGACVAREILALIDQSTPTLLNKIMTIEPQPALPVCYEMPIHPDCGCRDYAGVPRPEPIDVR